MNRYNMNQNYKICVRCVMDTSALDISFNDEGICHYCTEFLNRSGHIFYEDQEDKKKRLNAFVTKVKKHGKRNLTTA